MEAVIIGVGVVLAGLVLAVIAVFWIVRSPWAYNQFQDVIAEMGRDNQQLRTELAANDQANRELRRELQRAEEKIGHLERYAADAARYNELLADRLRALGALDIPPAPQLPHQGSPEKSRPGTWSEEEKVDVARKLAALFDADEVHGLAFELGMAEGMTGDTAAKRARWLVSHAARTGRFEELKELCRQERPNGGF